MGKDFGIALAGTDIPAKISVWAVWTEGPYECMGFSARSAEDGRLLCSGVGTKAEAAKFCEKVEAATFESSTNAQTHLFSMP